MHTSRLIAALTLATLTHGAQAADITFNMTGRVSDILTTVSPPWVGRYGPLTDSDTADGALPALTLSVGDSVTAATSFDRALDVPASTPGLGVPYQMTFDIALQGFDTTRNPVGATLYYTVDWHFFNHGVEVDPGLAPSSREYGCGGGEFCLSSTWAGQTAAFSFDSLNATGHITAIFDSTNASVSSVEMVQTQAQIFYGVAAVPEPRSALMILSGMAMLCWRWRRITKG